MVDNLTDVIEEILDLDSVVQHQLRNSWPESWLQINLPLGSTRALLAIDGLNAHTPGRVADALGVSRTTVTGLLDRLEGEGLITRAIDPHDRRCFVLHLTEKGQTLVGEINGRRREHIRLGLAKMDTESLVALRQGMAALAAAMKAGEPVPSK